MDNTTSQQVHTTPDDPAYGLLGVIRCALWPDAPAAYANREIFAEARRHAVTALMAPILSKLSKLSLPADLYKEWQRDALQQVTWYYNCVHYQDSLPIDVPYVILKGTSAAKYYPHPELRVLGDIDIMTRREDYDAACTALCANGWAEALNTHDDDVRHREFARGQALVEVHAYFASLNDPAQAKYLDDLIIAHIDQTHVLPDLINGLVLLEHISQHLEHGLGLRQIIDWMMFVNACLTDEAWPAFRDMAARCGMERLAVVTTRMCEIYLGLPTRRFAAGVDEALCGRLMDYVLACGNFGSKWTEETDKARRVLTGSRSISSVIRILQRYGLENWPAARRHALLRPFAWLYQAGHYMRKGLLRRNAASMLSEEFSEARRRKALFDALGVKQTAKGLVIYRDGRYVKE